LCCSPANNTLIQRHRDMVSSLVQGFPVVALRCGELCFCVRKLVLAALMCSCLVVVLSNSLGIVSLLQYIVKWLWSGRLCSGVAFSSGSVTIKMSLCVCEYLRSCVRPSLSVFVLVLYGPLRERVLWLLLGTAYIMTTFWHFCSFWSSAVRAHIPLRRSLVNSKDSSMKYLSFNDRWHVFIFSLEEYCTKHLRCKIAWLRSLQNCQN
jgi:hypothetical protein